MRIFAALPLPAQAVAKLEEMAAELKNRYPDLRVVKPQGMHITMVFFGELHQDQVLEIMRVMDNPELKVASIQTVLGGIGQFPPKGPPRVIYCPIHKGAPEISYLYHLYYQLLSNTGGLSIEEQREFTPHISLARNRDTRVSLLDVEELFRFEYSLILDRFVLYQSILRPQGAEYKTMKTVMLG